ncbi:PhnD/SsuA/transferrin family substrate-binding protein [Spiroplasma floricola]|uniref:Phosphonate ABC transporter substrate-binding protein n=1 Tax=Spiroplasma floricola 23-6 TaxID=1336749 RepID=A0A2K8SER4_9MOLU|nr:PhnD/SsuA/transferrin family substrate-binding protein [Spiroplasma floricola]AUB31931.1 phosphonate ABC transporter substrate-binding protein [Spiroplasma floricola 23-6]
MKKLLSLFAVSTLIASSVSTVVSCGGSSDTINILFIPSNNSTEIINTVKPLEQKLATELSSIAQKDGRTLNKKVKISTSTNYEVAGKTLQDGKADLAFLPINTYVKYRGKDNEGKFSSEGVLLSASRSGVTPETKGFEPFQTDGKFDSSKAQNKAIDAQTSMQLAQYYNKTATGIENLQQAKEKLEDSENTASYYRSYIYANNAFLSASGFDITKYGKENLTREESVESSEQYKADLKALILKGATEDKFKFSFGKSKTSSAGVLYPMLWLKNVLGFEDSELQGLWKKASQQESYPQAAENISNAQNDGAANYAVGFSDIRSEQKDDNKVKKAFANSTVIGATDAIPNDLIVYSKKRINDEQYKDDLRTAFINLIAKPENKEIFNIYSHTGYIGPTSKEASESFEVDMDSSITRATVETAKMLELMKNW